MEGGDVHDSSDDLSEVCPELKFSGHNGEHNFLVHPLLPLFHPPCGVFIVLIRCTVTLHRLFCDYLDAIGSVSFHPIHPLVLSVSGSRHFDTEYPWRHERHASSFEAHPDATSTYSSDSSDEDSEDSKEDGLDESRTGVQNSIRRRRQRPHPVPWDDSMRVWSFANIDTNVGEGSRGDDLPNIS